jgi:hypothetical protein
MQRKYIIAAILSLFGLAVWLTITILTGNSEAWDSPYYYSIGLPVMFLSAAIAGYIDPRYRVLWAISLFILQPVALMFQSDAGPFLIIGLFFFMLFAAIAYACTYIGSEVHRQLIKSNER